MTFYQHGQHHSCVIINKLRDYRHCSNHHTAWIWAVSARSKCVYLKIRPSFHLKQDVCFHDNALLAAVTVKEVKSLNELYRKLSSSLVDDCFLNRVIHPYWLTLLLRFISLFMSRVTMVKTIKKSTCLRTLSRFCYRSLCLECSEIERSNPF